MEVTHPLARMGYDIKDSDCNSSSPTQCTFDYINVSLSLYTSKYVYTSNLMT